VLRHGRWLLALGSTLLGLAFCEAAIRLLGLAPPVHAIWRDDPDSFYQRSPNPLLNYVIKPNHRATVNGRPASSNEHGFRDRSRSLAKPEGVRRVILLGDSVVEGISYTTDEDTISRQLEQLYPDGRTEVLNMGVSGYCTRAEVALLEERGLAFEPDLVVLLFVMNDYNNFNPEHTTAGGVSERPGWSQHLFVHSSAFRLAALRWNWFGFADEAFPNRRNHLAIGDNNVVTGLAELRRLANRHGFRVLIAAWPIFDDTYIGYPNPIGPPPLIIERLAAMNGLPVARLDYPFRDHWRAMDPRPNPRRHYTVDGDRIHPTPETARLAARFLKELIDSPIPAPPYHEGPYDAEAVRFAGLMSDQLSLAPEPMEGRIYDALMRQGRQAEAEAHLRRLLDRNPRLLTALSLLGRDLFVAGRIDEARPFLERALELQPEAAEVRVRLAFCLQSEGDGRAAEQLLLKGLQTPADPALIHYGLGAIYLTNQAPEKAERHLQLARQLAPRMPELPELFRQLEAARKEGR